MDATQKHARIQDDDPRHGTLNAYCNLRCRCQPCRNAWSAYCAQKRASRALPEGDPLHGTENGYGNYGCRCERCREARNEWRRHHRRIVREQDGQADFKPCLIPDCDRSSKGGARGWCALHYNKWWVYGDPQFVQVKVNKLAISETYKGIHFRLRRDRGMASAHSCVGCGHRAYDWSYDNNDPEERSDTTRQYQTPMPYSLDQTRYSPRCRKCHKEFDLARRSAN